MVSDKNKNYGKGIFDHAFAYKDALFNCGGGMELLFFLLMRDSLLA
jgi:hypothetical protein